MLLEVQNMRVNYGMVEILKGISFQITEGAIVCLLGANGAGKSTTLKALSGLIPISAGEIRFAGERVDGLSPRTLVQKGIIQVPERRRLFPEMSVMENFEMGAYLRKDRGKLGESLEEVLTFFPPLKPLLRRRAGTLSGGEQQMVAVGRALMSEPRLLLMDEPTLGLSPALCIAVIDWLSKIQNRGTSILLAEQNANIALQASQEGYVLSLGEIILHGDSQALLTDERVKKAYLGE